MAAAIAHAMIRIRKRKYDKCIAIEYNGLPYLEDLVIIRDAGRTTVKPGTITCIAGYSNKIEGKLL